MTRRRLAGWSLLVALAGGWGCDRPLDPDRPPQTLESYGLFAGPAREHRPAPGVLGYELNTPLFSDHAAKLRFVKLPEGGVARYREDGPFDFPVGTLISKTFAYPRLDGDGMRLIETRILWHTERGWIGLPYVWNDAQTEAVLEIAGETVPVRYAEPGGSVRRIDYRVPNTNQCKACHRVDGETMTPIGPRAAQLNRPWRPVSAAPNGSAHAADAAGGATAGGGSQVNQLDHWVAAGALAGAPPAERAPRWPVWDDPATGSLDRRARAWLDVNCAHCHNPGGPARTSSLDLRFENDDPTRLGVYKSPVAAGRGSGDRLHDIEPGRPERSILLYRLESLDPGIMMPELGRTQVDGDGVELIRRWIAEMPDPFASHAGS